MAARRSRLQLPAVEQRLQQRRADAPDAGSAQQVAELRRLRAERSGQRDLRIQIGGGDADRRARLVQLRFGRADVRPLAHELRRQADGHLLRQRQRRELECRQRRFARQPSGEHGELVPRCGRARARAGAASRASARPACSARARRGAATAPSCRWRCDELELPLLRRDDLARGVDLRAQRGLAHGRGDDVRREREVGAIELVAAVIDLRLQPFELAPVAAEHVERVRDVHRGVVQIEDASGRHPDCPRATAAGESSRASPKRWRRRRGRATPPSRRRRFLLRLAQRRLGRGERRTVGDGVADQAVERVGPEKRPPVPANGAAGHESLRRAAQSRRTDRCGRQRRLGIARRLRAPPAPGNRGRPRIRSPSQP